MADKAWSGNVGEWGELYAACKLLGTGQLSISESDAPYRLLALQRPETTGSSRYTVEGTDVRAGSNRGLIPCSEYSDAADLIRRSITRRTTGARTFSLAPEIQARIQHLGFSKISAGSAVNSDISLEVLAPNEIDRIQLKGFSIKTEAGSAPTFYNMSGGRHLNYTIQADPAALKDFAKSLNAGGRGRKDVMTEFARSNPIIQPGTLAYPHIFHSDKVAADFRGLDGDAPRLIALSVIEHYFHRNTSGSAATLAVASKDPLGGLAPEFYRRKYAQIWREFSRGIGGRNYVWSAANLGGIIRVKADYSIEAVPTRDDHGGDLVSRTKFDEPDFGRWLDEKGFKAVTMSGAASATLILPWQVRWGS
jgi:hypothetical protein